MASRRPLLREIIRQRRDELGMSVIQLAKATGCSPESISNIEGGHEPIQGFRIKRLAGVLRLNREALSLYYLYESAPRLFRQTFGDITPPIPKPVSE